MGELNIAPVECLNILYEITHPQKIEKPYEDGKHSYGHIHIINGKKRYLEIKYNHLPYAKILITYLSLLHIPYRKIAKCLRILDSKLPRYEVIRIQSCVGIEIANEIYKIINYYKILEEVK